MRIAITGSQGDLGSALSRTNPGHRLRLIDRIDPPAHSDSDYRQIDVCNLPELTDALRGCDAVAHLAAIRSPDIAPPEVVYRVNTLGTYNITLAAETLSIHTVINASSICYYGYIFRSSLASPPYFPIDELTPPHPEDSYSLSKFVSEEIMKAFVQRTNAAVASLRFCLLMPNGAKGMSPRLVENSNWQSDTHHARSWWTYVDIDDAARAVWLSLSYLTGKKNIHTPFNISADDMHTTIPTRELIARHFADVADLRYGTSLDNYSNVSLFSNAKAQEMLGYSPSAPLWREKLGDQGATL